MIEARTWNLVYTVSGELQPKIVLDRNEVEILGVLNNSLRIKRSIKE